MRSIRFVASSLFMDLAFLDGVIFTIVIIRLGEAILVVMAFIKLAATFLSRAFFSTRFLAAARFLAASGYSFARGTLLVLEFLARALMDEQSCVTVFLAGLGIP